MDFDNILIEPQPTRVSSRSEVDLIGDYPMKSGQIFTGIPIIASNMSGIGTFDVARVLTKNKMLTSLVKTYSASEIIGFFEEDDKHYDHAMMSIGITNDDLTKLDKVMSVIGNKMKFLMVSVANGYMHNFVDTVKSIKEMYPHISIFAGNVVTSEGVSNLEKYADVVLVGIGSGSFCRTRTKTGVGVPQVSAIENVVNKFYGVYIASDGGCRYAGDVAKAFAVGSDFVMLGTMLAGTDEGYGEIVTRQFNENGECYKYSQDEPPVPIIREYKYVKAYGMSSQTANDEHFGGMKDYKTSEGITALVPYKGPIQNVINDIAGGLRSACSYSDSFSLEEFAYKANVIECTQTHSTFLEQYKVGD